MNIRDQIQEDYPDVEFLFMDPEVYDAAIIGVMTRCGKSPTIAYDSDRVIRINVNMGMNEDEAIEYYEYNQEGAYVGDQTPVFITNYNSTIEYFDGDKYKGKE